MGRDEVSAVDFANLSPMTLADCLPRSQVMEFGRCGPVPALPGPRTPCAAAPGTI